MAIAWTRLRASSLVMALRMWVLIVSPERNEPVGDLLARQPLGQQLDDLTLAPAEGWLCCVDSCDISAARRRGST